MQPNRVCLYLVPQPKPKPKLSVICLGLVLAIPFWVATVWIIWRWVG